MYAHIEVLAAGVRSELECGLDGGTRVLCIGANQNDLADVAVVDFALCLSVGLVEAAHEAELENQVGMSLDDLLSVLALCDVRAERLLAENVLAVVHRDLDLLAVQEGRGNDNDRVQLRVPAHLLEVGVGVRNAQLSGNFLDAVLVYVADSSELAARDLRCEVLCVLITQTAQTDRTNLDSFHS